jgi:urea transport system permease protein
MSAYGLTLASKIMCYALCAVALVWGYCGVLSLGHGLFFALGGYAMGMYLMRQVGREGVYQSDLPDFMVFLDWKAFRGSGAGRFILWAIGMSCSCPSVAFVFGWFAFRSRVKGVYLSIIAGADLCGDAAVLPQRHGLRRQQRFTDFKRILGFPIAAIGKRVVLFVATGIALAGKLVACRAIVRSS